MKEILKLGKLNIGRMQHFMVEYNEKVYILGGVYSIEDNLLNRTLTKQIEIIDL